MQLIKNITTYSNAESLLDKFLADKVKRYGQMRNFDFGNIEKNFVSGLSPAINKRIISEHQIASKLLQNYKYTDVEKFIEQLCWRTYWKGYLEHYSQIWDSYIKDLEALERDVDLAAAINAKTGIKCFDHWVEELIETGHLHNHSRMWFASIWVFTLELPWQLGASFFMENLLDADCASNTLSWRWVSGLHTKCKNYLASPSNIKKFTGQRFEPIGQLATEAKPITTDDYSGSYIHSEKVNKVKDIQCYMIHENDLSHEQIPNCEFLLIQKYNFGMIERSAIVKKFIDDALKNLQVEIKKRFPAKIVFFTFDERKKLKAFIEKNKISKIYSSYPTVGSIEKELEDLFTVLTVKHEYLLSAWDQLFWPHTSKGYFKLRTKIPAILNTLFTKKELDA